MTVRSDFFGVVFTAGGPVVVFAGVFRASTCGGGFVPGFVSRVTTAGLSACGVGNTIGNAEFEFEFEFVSATAVELLEFVSTAALSIVGSGVGRASNVGS